MVEMALIASSEFLNVTHAVPGFIAFRIEVTLDLALLGGFFHAADPDLAFSIDSS